MAVGDAIKAALVKAGLDAARESAASLTQALRDAEAAAAALDKRGPVTPQEAATAEVRRLASEARRATTEVRALERAQERAAAQGLRAAGQQVKASERKAIAERAAGLRRGVADAARMQREEKAARDKQEREAEKKSGGGGAGGPKDLKYLLKHAGIGKAAMGAMGAAGGLELTKLALGYRGMAQLQALTQRASLQFRQLFAGINPAPVVRAADRFYQTFSKATLTGQALSGIFKRMFDGLFGGVERAEPIITSFIEGMVGGALNIEIAYYKARLALLPLTDAIEDLIGPIDSMGSAAMAGQSAVIALGVAAAIATAPYLPFAAAILAVVKALEQLAKLQREIEGAGGLGAAAKDMGRHFMRESDPAERERAEAAKGRAAYDQAEEARRKAAGVKTGEGAPAGNAPAVAAAGAVTGKAYAEGLAKGVAAGQPGVDAAGAAAGQGLDTAARGALKVKSPSKVGEETGGQYPAGLARGVDRRAPEAQEAMVRAATPPKGEGGAGRGTVGGGDTAEIVALLRRIEENTRGLAQAQQGKPAHGPGIGKDLRTIGRALGVGAA